VRSIKQLIDALNTVLFEEWDPIGLNAAGDGWPRDEYETYVPHIVTLLTSSSSDADIAAHLADLESQEIGVAASPLESRLQIVKRLRVVLREHQKRSQA
jgi:hypothetical protein